MSETPWLSIVGLGEDGPDGLSGASRAALEMAEIVMGPPRHLALLPDVGARRIEWPVPFADGVARLLELRGQRVVMLASGDPFWFGAGRVVTGHLEPHEWQCLPGRSTFSLAASCLGWALETTTCLGLHADPLMCLRPHLSPGNRAIVLLRDAASVRQLAKWLGETGFGPTKMHVLEALGGPRARVRVTAADNLNFNDILHPVCVGLEMTGDGPALGLAAGRADALFQNDGQITKAPMRALTLSALAPRHGEHLWDIGGGSGSVAIEWLLCHPSTRATTIETRAERAVNIRLNADNLGVGRLQIITGKAPVCLAGLAPPDVVFIGGGLSADLLGWLHTNLSGGTRLVANAVTLESQALLADWQARLGGDLLRIELAHSKPLGSKRVWRAALPLVQWSVAL